MSAPLTLVELAEQKIANFKDRFAEAAAEAGLAQDLEELRLEKVLSYLLLAKPYWGLIEEDDWESLDLLLEATGDERTSAYFTLSPELKGLLRRYVRFFLKWTREVTKDGRVP